jgi:glutamate formiminotransferase/formiminotetrahydrofolate cyclodeaminase
MLDAGKYFLKKQNRSTGVSESELIHIAVKSLGLDDLTEFHPGKKIIEYRMKKDSDSALQNLTVKAFADMTASESPAPGGGSVSAYLGALGASLGTMVANLSAGKNGWESRLDEFSQWAEKGQAIKEKLLKAVDEDTAAFNRIMAAFALPKNTDAEKQTRKDAIKNATIAAIEVPYKVMQLSLESMQLIKAMAETGNPNSVSDAGVGALCARSAVLGAHLNVKINAAGLADKSAVEQLLKDAANLEQEALKLEGEILQIVERVIEKS